MTETVLVTGGTGFVAGWCVAGLLDRGYAVRTTIRDPAKESAVRAAAGGREGLSFAVADLTRHEDWDAAVAGCDYVLHVASPLGGDGRGTDESLVAPARDGALRVLAAAARAGVKRVVMTSSTAAATPSDGRGVSDETVWTDPTGPGLTPYRRSKLLAERAAWDFMAAQAGAGGTTLTTILPVAIFGPVLSRGNASSVDIVGRLLAGRPPLLPRFGFTIVDVRDLADLHIRAMTAPEAAGERFIAGGEFMWLADIARTLREHLGDRAGKVPGRGVPDGVVRALARFVPDLRALTPLLGRQLTFSGAKAQRMLGFTPRPATATIVDCAESLLPARSLIDHTPAR
ncbi:NAD-dependent epimerase/dehydratase family protein [Phytohabitans sp. ZYX-F-186]|uniref:NAD-dependent epimerase/dehydratase family protein n=1 Tax=Phytohabitans maris TaxID=3071409 RepID=A0ABU0ZBH6_9ACTN|nr:NAD-dependent epimerase/dehydratase family protein [Phytohabitans sp. ZYX-F-186]MDQ7904421.1 NAD-dependent epimerase/dehydratase family protein [Phytohabitans sp. ZYX-F-186]